MTYWLSAAAVLLGLLTLRHLWKKRFLTALIGLFITLFLTAAAIYSHQISLNLQSYSPVLFERDIAEIRIQTGPQGREVVVQDLVSARSYRWQPMGSEWQMELRILRPSGVCLAFGWGNYYRLSRLLTRETPQAEGKPLIHSVELRQNELGFDIWKKTRHLLNKRPDLRDEVETCVMAETMDSSRQPLPDQGVFRASIREDGLQIRPFAPAP